MSNSKISALTSATTPLAGTETLPIVQSGATVKVAVSDLTAGRAVSFAGATSTSTVWLQDATLLQGGYNALRWSIGGTDALVITPRSGYSIQLNGPSESVSDFTADTKIWLRDAATLEGGYNALRWTMGGTDNLTITPRSGYNTKLATGNLIIGTSGNGIDFSATPGTGTSELFADYEEGTWTPVVTPGSGSLTSYTSSGTYTKVGRVVCLTGTVLIVTAGTAAGQLNMSGLPFTASVSKNQIGTVREDQNTGYIYFIATTGASTNAYIQSSINGSVVWLNGYGYVFSLTYIA